MQPIPWLLAVGSQKGGTGRTTTALALAWLGGAAGQRVALIDADPVQAAALVAAAPGQRCAWANVRLFAGMPTDDVPLAGCDLVIVDCPSLTEPAAQAVLCRADAVLLTCLPESYCLRTLPAAVAALAAARRDSARPELLGLLATGCRRDDPQHARWLAELRAAHGSLLLEPPVPWDRGLRDWPLTPGADLPVGAGAVAYRAVAEQVLAARLAGAGVR
ncbi:MAG: ParA family protein [Planctomycetia bacterium]|nr:ParA family protein [Planctomycetia bacterium]